MKSWQTIVKENNLSVSEVFFTDLKQRLDAEYYDPVFIRLDRALDKKNIDRLGNLTEKIDVGFVGSMVSEYVDSGILLLQTRNVKEFFVDTTECQSITDQFHKKIKKSQIHKNEVLIARSGSFGNAAIYFEDEVVNSSDIIIIRSKPEIKPSYLTAFINSQYGRFQLVRFSSGGLQGHVNLTILEELKVVLPTDALQIEIEKIVYRAYAIKKESERKYAEAEKLLLKEINLEGYVPSEENTSVRELAECLADNRFDAEYWEPRFDEMEEQVSNIPQKELGDIVSMKKGIDPGSEAYTENGKAFVRVSDISIYGIEEGDKKISDELYEELKTEYKPKKGEVLFTKDGTIGISFALHEDIDAIVSGAFLRLKPEIKINIDYLTLVLNSLYCKFQIERMSGGAIIAHLKPENVKKIKVPVLSDAK